MYKFLKFKSEQSSVTVQYERLLQYNIRQFGYILMNISTAHSARHNTK